MIELVIGTAAGLLMAVASMLFYRKGLRDGMGQKKGGVRKVWSAFDNRDTDSADGDQSELMKKYEMILNYDPYGERV